MEEKTTQPILASCQLVLSSFAYGVSNFPRPAKTKRLATQSHAWTRPSAHRARRGGFYVLCIHNGLGPTRFLPVLGEFQFFFIRYYRTILTLGLSQHIQN